MAAVWMRAKADLRARWRSFAALTLLLGLAAGVVMAASAGARRTDSAYSRFLASVHHPDAGGFISGGFGFPPVDARRVAALPQVSDSVLYDGFLFLPQTSSGAFSVVGQGAGVGFDTAGELRAWAGFKMLQGTTVDPDDPHQILVGYGTAGGKAGGMVSAPVHPGERLTLRFLKKGVSPDVFGQSGGPGDIPSGVLTAPFPVTVKGIVFEPGDVGDNSYGDVIFTPAFDRAFRDRVATLQRMSVRLRRGQGDAAPFLHELAALTPGGNGGWGSAGANEVAIQRSIRPQGAALAILAGLVALSALLVLGQAVARRAFLDSNDNETLRALGVTPGQLVRTELLKALVMGALSAAIGLAVAVALSATMPVGLARVAEPAPGVSFDWTVFAAGVAILLGAVSATAAIPAWRSARTAATSGADPNGVATRPSALANTLARWGLPPSAVAGGRMALEPGRGRAAVPVRSTLVGVTLSVVTVTAALGFAAGFDHLFRTPRLYGWGWDAALGTPYSGADLTDRIVPKLRSDPDVGGVAGGFALGEVDVSGSHGRVEQMPTVALDQITGSVHPPILAGRWPRTDGEIALGPKPFRRLSLHLGDAVEVRAGTSVLRVRVVGRAELFDFQGTGDLGQGVGMTLGALHMLTPGVPTNVFLADFRPGVDEGAALDRLRKLFQGNVGTPDPLQGNLEDLAPVRHAPAPMAGLLAFAAIAAIGNALVTSIRRRRRDLAILKTLGFVRRQVAATVAWEASIIGVIALAVGIPVGIAAGRWAWTTFADNLGVIPQAVIPVTAVVVAVPIALAVANLIAAVPGRIAARVRPARILRAE